MSTGSDLISLIASRQNLDDYQKKHWSGSFAEYLDIVKHDPKVTRTAYQRLYDMIISKGTEEIVVNKEKLVRYKFFEDPDNNGEDAIFGLERTLMNLVNILKSAAQRLRDRAAGAAPARPGGQLQEHASPGCSRRAWSATRAPTRGVSSRSAGRRSGPTARRSTPIARCTRSRSTWSRTRSRRGHSRC